MKLFIYIVCFCVSTYSGRSQFAKGADISWLTEMEQAGKKFYYLNDAPKDCLSLLSANKKWFESVRLRLFVNPADGWCNLSDVIAKAERAKNAGYRIMVDIHYSDKWADPAAQQKPASWVGLSYSGLLQKVYDYTRSVMTELKNKGIEPAWVQIGNETNDGMLWPDGKISSGNAKKYAELVNKGYDAVKSINSSSKVIIHLGAGANNTTCRWVFDSLKTYGAKWDVIGVSLYPGVNNWETYTDLCLANLNDMISRYNKEVMICETGMAQNEPMKSLAFLSNLIRKVRAIPNNKGLGVFYWEPECGWGWPVGHPYGLGAFDSNNRPTAALEAFMCEPYVLNSTGTGGGAVNKMISSVPVNRTDNQLSHDAEDYLDAGAAKFAVHPNPFNKKFTISVPRLSGKSGQLQILDMNGEIVFTSSVTPGDNEVETRLSSGSYCLVIFDRGQLVYRKVILAL